MNLKDRIKDRRNKGQGLLAWLLDRGGWRTLVATAADVAGRVRRARHGEHDPIARGADAVGDIVDIGRGNE